MSTVTITPVDEAAMDAASSKMRDLVESGQWKQLHKEILVDEVFAIRVAIELKRQEDTFYDFSEEVAEWVREANHPGESMDIMDAMWASEIRAVYGVTIEKALLMIAAYRAKN